MNSLVIGDKKVSENSRTLIIAEAGINHDGDFNQAIKLIDIAAEAGADIVKFQLFKAGKMITPKFGDFKNAAGKTMTMLEVLGESEMPASWIPKLMEHCKEKNIGFLCTPCDEQSAEILNNYGADSFKIASSELSHLPLLQYIAGYQKPIIMSEAGAYLSDVDIAIRTIERAKNDKIALLHCVYKYPTPIEECNLAIIQTYKKAFPEYIIGYSDHTLDPVKAPVTAVVLGAKIIEKHFTLDKTLPGADHSFALSPDELKLMCDSIRYVESLSDEEKLKHIVPEAVGSSRKQLNRIEEETRRTSYRCLMTTTAVKSGAVISAENIDVLRPGYAERGLDSKMYSILIDGHFKFTKDIGAGEAVKWEHILSD